MAQGTSSDEPVSTRAADSAGVTPPPPVPATAPIPAPAAPPRSGRSSPGTGPGYAMRVANGSYDWYHNAAIRARRNFRLTETLLLLVSASIPVSAVISPGTAVVPAILGGVVVVITGLRSVFHWQDDYLRFSEAREAVEAERRLYYTGAEPYAAPDTRDQMLATNVTRIEQREMGTWIQLASPRTDATGSNAQY
ncbi:DUF4231 domain-containing protein [Streptomyces sp. NBC_01017]|uniref:DUF4231 domain-containing protein n=1 Tax=Streptomyces machairae TaxID=3134109 RepID=A0ABU8USR6_9ACTN|nr:DUF4231 domain-containing protein [Streptomyces sp. NBC_01017]